MSPRAVEAYLRKSAQVGFLKNRRKPYDPTPDLEVYTWAKPIPGEGPPYLPAIRPIFRQERIYLGRSA